MPAAQIVTPLVVTLTIQAMVSMVAVTVPVLAPSAAPDIGISATSVGLFVSLIYIGSMLSSLWSSNYIVRFGPLRVSQICLLFSGVGLMLTAVGTIPALVVSAFIIGLGYGPVTPASSHLLSRTTPAHMMSFIFSVKQTGVPLGGMLAGAVVPTLVLAAGWRNGSVIVGCVSVLLALAIIPARESLDIDRQPEKRIGTSSLSGTLKLVISDKGLARLALISFLYAGMQLCLFTYLVIYLTKDISLSFVAAGFVLSAAQIAGSVGRVVWGFIADRYMSSRLLLGMLGLTMSIGSLATAFLAPGWPYYLIVLVLIFFGATAIGWNGVYLAEAARLAPQGQVGAATGGTLFFTFLGVVLGPPLFAAVAAVTGSYPAGFIFFALLTFAGGLYTLFSG